MSRYAYFDIMEKHIIKSNEIYQQQKFIYVDFLCKRFFPRNRIASNMICQQKNKTLLFHKCIGQGMLF